MNFLSSHFVTRKRLLLLGWAVGGSLAACALLATIFWAPPQGPAPPRRLDPAVAEPVLAALRVSPSIFTWGSNPVAPTAYVFEDANCSFCADFDRVASPLVAGGRLRLKIVLVSFLKPSSAGRAAAIWRDPSPELALERNASGFHALTEDGAITPVAVTPADQRALALHMALLRRIGPVETPTLLFRQGGGWVVSSGFQPGIFQRIAAPGRTPQAQLSTMTLRLGASSVVAEVASTREQMEVGLMGRQSLAPNHGMLFEFNPSQRACMWMKDTHLALSVAFLDGSGSVINSAEMDPMTLDSHCASRPARYALEMPAGWFSSHRVMPGFQVEGLTRASGVAP